MGNSCAGVGGATAEAGSTFVVQVTGQSVPVRTVRKLGWKPDLPDFRDRVLSLPAEKTANLPSSVDLRKSEAFAFEIYDQGSLGSCTANAIGAAFQYDQRKEGLVDSMPSRLFIYYNERAMEGSVDYDAGAYIRDGVKSVNKLGVCAESLWPYDESKFTAKPSDECYTEAAKNLCTEYARVTQTLDEMKACLSEGFPFVFGFTVFYSFFDQSVAETGMMSMPLENDPIAGGHAVLAVGYDDEKGCFIVRNSWGEGWGDQGFFYMPYAYIADPSLASDFWMMRTVEGTVKLPTRAISATKPAPAPLLAVTSAPAAPAEVDAMQEQSGAPVASPGSADAPGAASTAAPPSSGADLEKRFTEAAERVKSTKPCQSDQLLLYGWFKQAKDGDVTGKRPWAPGAARLKYDAWGATKGTSKVECQQKYIAKVDELLKEG